MLHCSSRLVSMQVHRAVLDAVGRPREQRSALDKTTTAKHFAELAQSSYALYALEDILQRMKQLLYRRFASCRDLTGMPTDVHMFREAHEFIRSK